MKKTIYTVLMIAMVIPMVSCDEEFLDRYPEDAMSDATFFTKASDFKTYVNGLYGGVVRNVSGNRWVNLENGSDNLFTDSPHGSLMRHSVGGEAGNTNNLWNDTYSAIRQVNYMLDNKGRILKRDGIVNQYLGEAFFIRAFHYFNLLEDFGGVPYIDNVLNTDSPELFSIRESRHFIALKIIADVDSAIALLQWKGTGAAGAARINRESALAFKTRVGLFEGSWEHYHGNKNTPFKMDGEDGSDFLQEAVEAGEQLITYQGSQIYKGPAGAEYSNFYNRDDYSNIPGVFFYKHYDVSLGIVSAETRASIEQYRAGLTKRAVYSYLMRDGKPEALSSVVYDYTDQNSLIHSRDPRLEQTIYAPDRGPFSETYSFITNENLSGALYANLNNFYNGKGGYTIFKGTVLNTVNIDQSNADDVILHYSEALLNYAEAKAILGTISQADIDKTVNVLRNRVGMASMDMAEVNGWSVSYSVSEGYDIAETNIVNEIRRERRVELMLEGFRTMDIKRWALFEDVFNGYKPVGAYFQELADYWNNPDNLTAAGFPESKFDDLRLELGQNIDVLGEFVNPFWQNADFTPSGRGYYIDPARDYLQPVPRSEILFYQEKGGVTLEQNPGWF